MVDRQPRHESRADLDGPAVAGQAGIGRGHLGVIEQRRHPIRRRRADARGMAALADIRGGHVVALLAYGLGTVVAAEAAGSDARVVEIGSEPGCGEMAIAALEGGDEMALVLARRRRAVMANDAEALDGERYLGVIHRLGRIPAHHRVAGVAGVTGLWMGGSLALGNRAVVTADAAAHGFAMIEVHIRPECNGVVAGCAVIAALHVRLRLRRCVIDRAGDVADTATSRRPLEHGIQVALFAGQVAVYAVEFEAGGQVIEGQCDRRCAGGGSVRRRHEHQERRRKQCNDDGCPCEQPDSSS
jgi:hypothetical protein